MSVSVTPSVLIVTVPLAGRGSAGSIEMSASVTFPVEVSFVRGCADTCVVLDILDETKWITQLLRQI